MHPRGHLCTLHYMSRRVSAAVNVAGELFNKLEKIVNFILASGDTAQWIGGAILFSSTERKKEEEAWVSFDTLSNVSGVSWESETVFHSNGGTLVFFLLPDCPWSSILSTLYAYTFSCGGKMWIGSAWVDGHWANAIEFNTRGWPGDVRACLCKPLSLSFGKSKSMSEMIGDWAFSPSYLPSSFLTTHWMEKDELYSSLFARLKSFLKDTCIIIL